MQRLWTLDEIKNALDTCGAGPPVKEPFLKALDEVGKEAVEHYMLDPATFEVERKVTHGFGARFEVRDER